MGVISKMILKSIVFVGIVIGCIYYVNTKLNSVDDEIQTLLAKNNYKIGYNHKDVKFRFLSNSITFHDVLISSKEDNGTSEILRVDEVMAEVSLFGLIFSGGKANNIVFQSPILNVYKASSNSEEKIGMNEIFKYLENLNNTKIKINRGRIINFDEKLIVVKELNEINGQMSKRNGDLSVDLQIYEELRLFKFKLKLKQLKRDEYLAEGSFFNENEKLQFKFNTEFDKKEVKSVDGAVSASGMSFPNLLSVFCSECSFVQDSGNSNFNLSSKISFDAENRILKLHNIDYKDKIVDYKGTIFYDFIKKDVSIDIKSEKWDLSGGNERITLSKIKSQILESEFSFLGGMTSYFELLQDSSFLLNFTASRIDLWNDFVTNIELKVLSNGKKIEIQTLHGKLNNMYEINSSGKILHNSIRNRLEVSVDIPFDSISGIKFDVSIMAGDISFTNVFVSDDKFNLEGDVFIRRNKESNELSGKLSMKNVNLNNVLENINSLTKTENIRGDFLSSLLVVASKMKLSSNLQIILEDSVLEKSTIDKISLNFDIDDKQIALNSFFVDKNLFNFKNRFQLLWDKLNPKVILKTTGEFIDIKKLFQLFNVKNYDEYLFLTEGEFKRSADSIVWKDFEINLSKFLNMSLVVLSNIKKLDNGVMEISDFKMDIVSDNNLSRINNISATVGSGIFNIAGNLDLSNQVIVGLVTTQNVNFNDFKFQKDEFPTYLSSATRFSTSGQSFRRLISNLVLNTTFVFKNVKFKNLDIDLFVNNVHKLTDYASLVSLTERSVVYGRTFLDDMSGNINIENGLMKSSFKFSTGRFAGAGLLNGLTQSLTFKGLSRIAFIPYKWQGTVYADLDWSGNLFNVNKSFDLEKLKSIVSR